MSVLARIPWLRRWCDDLYVPTSVLIVDDHAGFRARAREMLGSAGYRVVGEAADGAAGVGEARRLRPGVVLLDVQLPDTTGFEVARMLLAGPSPPVVVLVSSREAVDYGDLIERSGAAGFLTKSDLTARSLAALLGRAS
jgi:DNA-binding NarL/FixJ family response regulator